MGMSNASIAQNPTSSAPSGSMGGGKNMSWIDSVFPPSQSPVQQMGQFPVDQGARSNLQPSQSGKGGSMQPSNMTLSATSGQPQVGQPNPYPNTTGSWDNSSTQQSPTVPQMGGKGKGA